MTAKHHEDRRTKLVSNWNLAISTKQKGYRKQGRPAKIWLDELNTYLQPDRTNRDNNDFTSDMTWLTTAQDKSKWDATESDFISSTTHDPFHHDYATQPTTHEQRTYTTIAHDQNEDDTKDDDDDTLFILSQLIDC